MRTPLLSLSAALVLCAVAPVSRARAQAPIGSVEVSAAKISGTISIADGRALVGSNAIVTARDRTANLQLARGGEVLVCATSALHAARSPGPNEPAPLLLALDRGAVEIHMLATSRDTLLTPDLRFSVPATGPGLPGAGLLDLRIRVTGNGDTCVENRGDKAPTLEVGELFGNGAYLIRPGQHVLFEHGSLREVVDHETSPCGCPAPAALSVASNGISTDVTRAAVPKARVADDPDEVKPHADAALQYPFPAAESQGLSPTETALPPPEPNPTGEQRTQVAATLAFNPGMNGPSIRPEAAGSNGSRGGDAGRGAAAAGGASATTGAPAGAGLAAGTPAGAPTGAPAPAPMASGGERRTTTTAAPSPNQDAYESHEVAQAPLPTAAPAPREMAHGIRHFFRHLFGLGEKRKRQAPPPLPES